MGRVSNVVTGTTIDSTDFGNALITDYVSQTETGYTQTIPSPISASYIILPSGSDYYAINGLTKVCDFGGAGDAGGVDGADGGAVVEAAANAAAENLVFLRKADYSFSGKTFSSKTHFIGEQGATFVLAAKPSLTIDAETVFENIEFNSTVDGNGHVVIKKDVTFKSCVFDLQLDTQTENPIMSSNAVSKNKVIFRDCTLTGGKSGAEYFVLFRIDANMSLILLENFRIISVITDGASVGETRLFIASAAKSADLIEVYNAVWESITARYNGNSLVYDASFDMADTLIVDGFTFLSGTWSAANSHLSAFGKVADKQIMSNLLCLDRVHLYGGDTHTTVTNMVLLGSSVYQSGLDIGSSFSYPRYAEISNFFVSYGGIDTNSGMTHVAFSNGVFLNGLITALDEAVGYKGQERFISIDNVQWYYVADGAWAKAIELRYASGLKLTKLHITNCIANNLETFISVTGASSYPTHIILENVYVGPKKTSSRPRLIEGAARDSDDEVIWIFDSDLATYQPPLNEWNNIRPNDRFDNVKWINTVDDSVSYSENSGIAEKSDGDTIAHALVVAPTNVQLTIEETDLPYFLQLNAKDATNLTIYLYYFDDATNNLVQQTTDKTIHWSARVTP